MRLGNSCIERLQAARHSPFVMCVVASQKLMQSASDLPPPPGLLGFDWLGLLFSDVAPGERARSGEEPPEAPPAVPNWLGKGSDMGDSGDTLAPGCSVVGVVVAATPPGGVSPAEGVDDKGVGDKGVGDNDVDGPADVVAPEDTLGLAVGKRVIGAEGRGLGAAAPVDERTCANAASGSSINRATAVKRGDLGVSIAITKALPAVPLP